MKTNIISIFTMVAFMFAMQSCNMEMNPYNAKSDSEVSGSLEDLRMATYGAYSNIVNRGYTKNQHQIAAYAGDNFALSGTTGDQVYYTYTYTHTPTQGNTRQFWQQAYKVIYSANANIVNMEEGASPQTDQLLAENIYIRAMAHFDLVRIFARPYSQGLDNPGIPYKNNPDPDLPFRNTVKEVYDAIVADLLKAAELFTEDKDSRYASREVAYALLSRVYLYMEDNAKAIEYANKVIDSNRYRLMDTEAYKRYFTLVPEDNSETIFAFRHTEADDRGKDSIGSMYYADAGSSGWAEVYASVDYVELLGRNPNDVRHSFVEPQKDEHGEMLARNTVPRYYVNKFNYQSGIVNLSSPVYIRLAEMYLNRAEANAKLGDTQAAIDDVNTIRERAGLVGAQLYTTGDLKGHSSILDVVLEERRLEFAFEDQRIFDLFRNNRPLVRAYPGYHSADLFNQTILPTDNRVIHYIPEQEIEVNPNLTQNP